jgi:hypothetical protein
VVVTKLVPIAGPVCRPGGPATRQSARAPVRAGPPDRQTGPAIGPSSVITSQPGPSSGPRPAPPGPARRTRPHRFRPGWGPASGQAGGRAGGRAAVQASARAGGRAGGRADGRAGGRGGRACGRAGVSAGAQADRRSARPPKPPRGRLGFVQAARGWRGRHYRSRSRSEGTGMEGCAHARLSQKILMRLATTCLVSMTDSRVLNNLTAQDSHSRRDRAA